VDINQNLVFNYKMYNSSEDALTGVKTLDILPYNGDANGSSFSGSARLKSISFDQGVRVYYTTVPVNRLNEVGVVEDETGKIDPSKINLSRWTQIRNGDAINRDTTAFVYVKDRSSAEEARLLTAHLWAGKARAHRRQEGS